jgi:peptide/nickel transport system substrate-binding protein
MTVKKHQIIKNNGSAPGITRRAFSLRTGAALAGTAFGGTLIGLGTSVNAATPKRGGVARIAFNSTSPNDTLDPIAVTSNIDATRCYQLYSNLVRAGSDQRPEAQLATSWEASDDSTD